MKFDYLTVMIVLLAALFIFASIVAYEILSVPRGGDLTPQERYGIHPGGQASSTASSTAAYVPHKDYHRDAWGLSFNYPETMKVAENKDAFGQSRLTLTSGSTTITASVSCIVNLGSVPDTSWENNFTSPNYAGSIDPINIGTRLYQEFDKGSVSLFAFDSGAKGSPNKGFSAIACTGGTNRAGNQAGRCFEAFTTLLDPQSPSYGDLQNYFLNDFLSTIQFDDNFGNALNCPGLGD